MYDLESEEIDPEQNQVDGGEEKDSYKLLKDAADEAETLDNLAQSVPDTYDREYQTPDGSNQDGRDSDDTVNDDDDDDDDGGEDNDDDDDDDERLQSTIDPDIVELKALTKRGRDRDRNRGRTHNQQQGRGRAGSRRKGKDKNRKGKGRDKGRVPNYFVNVYGPQHDMPMNDVYVKAGKLGKDKTAMENEIQTIHRFMTCLDLHCEGGGRCIPDEMRAGGGVRCQCPLGRQGLFCEQGE